MMLAHKDPDLEDLCRYYRGFWREKPKTTGDAQASSGSNARPDKDEEQADEEEGEEEETCEDDEYVDPSDEQDTELGRKLGLVLGTVPEQPLAENGGQDSEEALPALADSVSAAPPKKYQTEAGPALASSTSAIPPEKNQSEVGPGKTFPKQPDAGPKPKTTVQEHPPDSDAKAVERLARIALLKHFVSTSTVSLFRGCAILRTKIV